MNNRDRFEREWGNCSGSLMAHCFHLTRNRQDAEDLFQDTAIKALKAYPSFEGRSLFKSWVYRIATNAANDRYKKKVWFTSPLEVDIEDSNQIDSLLERNLAEASIVRLQRDMPEIYFSVWSAWTIDGLKYEEIAAMHKVPVGTVKSRINRARIMQAAILSDFLGNAA